MHTFGTLGHVDHGKSTLVHALTGIDPDRLAEEKAREMTIDLGFAWMPLTDGERLGIVDVPGHRDFIDNMLAGITGVEAVLLVVAADEGVMPQTREHIAILNLLNIQHGIIVVSKTDMIDDLELLRLIEEEIRSALIDTQLAQSQLVAVSARTGANMLALRAAIEQCAAKLPAQKDIGIPQLAVDRVFTMHGFGTVVTGTLRNGVLHQGEDVEISPGALRSRVRTLQVFNQVVTTAYPGSRVAINLPNIARDQLRRGAVVSRPGLLTETQRLDAIINLLDDSPTPLRHNTEVKMFISTAQTEARIRVLGADVVAPGEQGWIQIETKRGIVADKSDHFVLRSFSPNATIGGGEIIDPHPRGRHRRFRANTITNLEWKQRSTPEERLAQLADSVNPVKADVLRIASGMTTQEFETTLRNALAEGLIIELLPSAFINKHRADAFIAHLRAELHAFHETNPLKTGIQQDIVRNRLNVKPATFTALVERAGDIVLNNGIAASARHEITFTTSQQQHIDALASLMAENPVAPPSYTAAAEIVGSDVLDALISLGVLVHPVADVIFGRTTYDRMTEQTLETIDQNGSVTVSQLRDIIGSSRKYILALLEDLDARGITRRMGDVRVRGHKS